MAEAKKPATAKVIVPVNAEAKKEEVKTEAKKAPAKKTPAKKEVSAKKTAAKETVAKAAASKESAKKEEALKATVNFEFSGKSYTPEDLVNIAKDVWKYDLNGTPSDFKTVELYVKPEESTTYYVINGDITGSFFI